MAEAVYRNIRIEHDPDWGYHGSNGCDEFGYCETVDELKAEIDDYWTGTEHGPLNGIFS